MAHRVEGMLTYYLFRLDKIQAVEEGGQTFVTHPWIRDFSCLSASNCLVHRVYALQSYKSKL